MGMEGGQVIEKWRIVDSLPRYEASNLGNVRTRRGRKPLSVWKDANGSLSVNTCQNGIQASRRVARLVAEAWCPSFKPSLRAFYRDGDRSNCRPSNLKWVHPSVVTKAPFSRNPNEKSADTGSERNAHE